MGKTMSTKEIMNHLKSNGLSLLEQYKILGNKTEADAIMPDKLKVKHSKNDHEAIAIARR